MIDHLCKAIVAEFEIRRFVETGLFTGETHCAERPGMLFASNPDIRIAAFDDVEVPGPPIDLCRPFRANRDNWGRVLLCKGFSPGELAFMAKLPFDRMNRDRMSR